MSSHSFNGHLPTLDGWRCIAILIVILAHGIESVMAAAGPGVEWLHPFHYQGGFGVSIFFALSGLLITTRLLEEQERGGGVSLRSFYIRRSFRILPAFGVMLGTTALLTALGILQVPMRHVIAAVFFVTNYTTDPS